MDYFSIIVSRRGLITSSHEPGKINVLLAVFLGRVNGGAIPGRWGGVKPGQLGEIADKQRGPIGPLCLSAAKIFVGYVGEISPVSGSMSGSVAG
jgi:hypothetical protein